MHLFYSNAHFIIQLFGYLRTNNNLLQMSIPPYSEGQVDRYGKIVKEYQMPA